MTELAWKSNKIETLDDIISIVGSDWIWLETYGQCLVDNIKTWIENGREKHATKVAAEQARKDAQKAAEKAAVMEATRKAAEAARKRRTTEAIARHQALQANVQYGLANTQSSSAAYNTPVMSRISNLMTPPASQISQSSLMAPLVAWVNSNPQTPAQHGNHQTMHV